MRRAPASHMEKTHEQHERRRQRLAGAWGMSRLSVSRTCLRVRDLSYVSLPNPSTSEPASPSHEEASSQRKLTRNLNRPNALKA